MKEFMDKDFLLETETARHLFHDYAEHMPLVDYHCHINPKEIYEDRRFDNLVEVWLGGKQPEGGYFGDHYKWRVMRSNGVSEDYITGDRPDYERFLKFVEALEMAIGNPMYHWCNLELRQFFGYDKPLTVENAEEAWNFCNEKLRTDPNLTVRGIIKKANVAFIGTTDDPVDTLARPSARTRPSTSRRKALPSTSGSWQRALGRKASIRQRRSWTPWCSAWNSSRPWAAVPVTTAWIMYPSAPPPPKRSTRFSKKRWPARA